MVAETFNLFQCNKLILEDEVKLITEVSIAILNQLWQCLKTAILALTGFQTAHLLQLI